MIGQKLKALRGKRRQEDIAKAIGISRARYSHYENEIREPDNDTLKLLANYFGVTVDYLLGVTSSSELIEQLNSNDIALSKSERDIAKRMKELRADLTSAEGLLFDGEPMSEEAVESLLEAMEFGVRTAKKVNKKYIPKKYRVDEED